MNDEVWETLVILQEECAEVIVEISKCMRFGPDQMMQGTNETNIQKLEKELGDLQAMIELLVGHNVGVSNKGISKAKRKKFEKLKTWSNITINK
jgi:NTP pyrophosphatase (non-canonical NTP hydrolase)